MLRLTSMYIESAVERASRPRRSRSATAAEALSFDLKRCRHEANSKALSDRASVGLRWNSENSKSPSRRLTVQQEIVAEIEGYQKVIDGARAVLDHYRRQLPHHQLAVPDV